MIKKELLRNCLFFDVETAGAAQSLQDLKENNPRLAKLWERRVIYYRSINENYRDADSSLIFQEKAGLEPEFARVVCVSFGTWHTEGSVEYFRQTSFYGENEMEILEKTNKVFLNAQAKGLKLCGHNIKGFDVPCLGKRMIYNGINPAQIINVWDKKPWEIPFLDTSEVFAFGSWSQQKYLSLDLLSCSLGVESPKEDIDGSQVHNIFWLEGDHEKIKTYCEKDVETVANVLEKVAI
jgi:hypothetical protein